MAAEKNHVQAQTKLENYYFFNPKEISNDIHLLIKLLFSLQKNTQFYNKIIDMIRNIYDKIYAEHETQSNKLFNNESEKIQQSINEWKLNNNMVCVICYEDYEFTSICNHRYCTNCLLKINKCAYCNKPFKRMIPYNDVIIDSDDDDFNASR